MDKVAYSFFQTGWVVDDIDRAMSAWAKINGTGPFFVRREVHIDTVLYRGVPTPLVVSIANGQSGDTQVELIQQHNNGPSAYRDTYPAGSSGFHHLGAFTDSFDDDLEQFREAGTAVVFEGTAGTARLAYFDTRSELGCMTEIVERSSSAHLQAFFADVAAASAHWDGNNPIREIG